MTRLALLCFACTAAPTPSEPPPTTETDTDADADTGETCTDNVLEPNDTLETASPLADTPGLCLRIGAPTTHAGRSTLQRTRNAM